MKIWRGWGAYEEEYGIGASTNGVEGEEIWSGKRETHAKSGLGTSSFIIMD